MDVIFFVILVLTATFIIVAVSVSSTKKVTPPYHNNSPIVEPNHLWHAPRGEYGENHADIVDDKIVNHPEPEPGYVVLNGIKRRLEDCKWL